LKKEVAVRPVVDNLLVHALNELGHDYDKPYLGLEQPIESLITRKDGKSYKISGNIDYVIGKPVGMGLITYYWLYYLTSINFLCPPPSS